MMDMTTKKVYDILGDSYGRGRFASAVNEAISFTIADIISAARENPDPEREFHHEILNVVWGNWPGGTTAKVTTNRILEAFHFGYRYTDL